MRKTLLVTVVLLFAVQAFAGTVTLSIDDEGGGKAVIRYTSDANVSAFGLKVTADSGAIFTDINDYNVGECTASVQGYGIFPGTIDINEDTGVVDDNGTPVAPNSAPGASGSGFGTDTLILEMGALYVDGNEPAKSGTLIAVYVDSDCNVCVEGEPIRGNVVLTDANEAIMDPNIVCKFIQVTVTAYDFGDAPDTYGTLMASGGAQHGDVGVMLGSLRDTEPDGQPSADAGDDDRNGGPDDEDGVVFNNVTALVVDVNVTVSQAGYLNAWIDWDKSGNWIPGEKVLATYLAAGGTYNFVIPVPVAAVRNADLFSRWRVTDPCMPGLEPLGLVDSGEVEDYNEPNVPDCHVPDVVGDPCDEAIAELIANGFTIGNITTEVNEAVFYNYVISTDPAYCNYPGCDTTVDVVVSEGSDCYIGQPDEADWTEVGRPRCWCYDRQCHGDADGILHGSAFAGYWWVGQPDLDIMSLGWLVKEPPKGSGIIGLTTPGGKQVVCADFGRDLHGSAFAGYWYIGQPDLDEMSLYWLEKNPPKGSGVPDDCVPGNRVP